MATEYRCEHCGMACPSKIELDVYHRSCRLKAAFPKAYTQKGDMVMFDIGKIFDVLEPKKKKPKRFKSFVSTTRVKPRRKR